MADSLTLSQFRDRLDGCTLRAQILDPEDDQRDPYEAEADQMRMIEWFFIHKNTDEDLQRRGDVLQNADHRERDLFRGRGEHQQGNGRHDPPADKKNIHQGSVVKEGAAAAELPETHIHQPYGKQDARLKCESV